MRPVTGGPDQSIFLAFENSGSWAVFGIKADGPPSR